MTENKAIDEIIKEVCSGCYGSDEEPHRCSTCGFKMAKDSLAEIQHYRAIGLTPELIEVMQGHNIALINDLGEYQSIGTIEEFKALKEKNEPKKPIEETDNYGYIEYYCPNCEAHLFFDEEQKFCNECGQALET